jgi:outer membrane protein assembly factor BamB
MHVSRRDVLFHGLAGSLLAATNGSLFAAEGSPDKPISKGAWPLFRGDAAATGVAGGTLPDTLELLWSKQIDNGAFEATATIVDGVVYLGDLDGTFYALELASGAEKWKKKRDTSYNASAAVRDGKVYIGDMDGKFFCLKASDGTEEWSFTTNAEINGGPNFWKDNSLFADGRGRSLICRGLR